MITRVAEDRIYITAAPTALPIVRQATEADVLTIAHIVNENVRQGHLLPRSPDKIRHSLPHWLVAELGGVVVGIGSLVEMSPTLVEVRSLAVLPAYRSYGVGAAIVSGLVERARERGFPTVFALTRAVAFFERLGFVITDKERFPEKVWTDCVVCPLQFACDETAMVLEVGD